MNQNYLLPDGCVNVRLLLEDLSPHLEHLASFQLEPVADRLREIADELLKRAESI